MPVTPNADEVVDSARSDAVVTAVLDDATVVEVRTPCADASRSTVKVALPARALEPSVTEAAALLETDAPYLARPPETIAVALV